jgi:hypothetical protein
MNQPLVFVQPVIIPVLHAQVEHQMIVKHAQRD